MGKLKEAVLVIFISVLVIVGGVYAYIYNSNYRWTNVIYPGVKIENEDLSGKTLPEAKKIIKEKYQDKISSKNITITAPNKKYSISYKELRASYNADDTLKKVYNYGKNLGILQKFNATNYPSSKNFKLKFTYDEGIIKSKIAAMEKDINKSPKDAAISLSNGSFTIIPEQDGVRLKTDQLEHLIKNSIDNNASADDSSIAAPIEVVKAKKTKAMISNINTRIASFSTDFSSSSNERINNIMLATRSINGTLLMPGESFSFNQVVGERTGAKGYQAAPVIIGNKIDSGLGGGICQVSTTLYNAVMRANINFTQRLHHTLPSHYVPLGMDATVSYGSLDYKFTNTLSYPIFIEGYTNSSTVGFNIYSNSALGSKSYDLANEVYQTIPAKTNYVNDATLPVGQTVQEQPASTGYRVKVYKNTYQGSKLLSHDFLYEDYYAPVNGIVKKGTR